MWGWKSYDGFDYAYFGFSGASCAGLGLRV